MVAHPECRDRCPLPCIPTLTGTPVRIGEVSLQGELGAGQLPTHGLMFGLCQNVLRLQKVCFLQKSSCRSVLQNKTQMSLLMPRSVARVVGGGDVMLGGC